MHRLHSVIRIPIVILLATLVSNYSHLAHAVSMDDLVKRDNLFFEKFTNTPFTGKVDEGLFRGAISKGLRQGEWIAYYESGQLRNQSTWRNGKKHDEWISYHDNGQLDEVGKYSNGAKIGFWKGYYPNGQLEYDGRYMIDRLANDCHIEPNSIGSYNTLDSLFCSEGVEDGLWLRYHENGTLRVKYQMVGGKTEGRWETYHDNGQIEIEGAFRNGEKHGVFKVYDSSGNLDNTPHPILDQFRGTFVDGKKVESIPPNKID